MKNSKIEWTDHTFNPWIGCTKVSPGCAHCYAEALDHRWGHDSWGPGKPRRRTSEANWKQPIAWDREAARTIAKIKADIGNASEYCGCGYERPRVFCASLSDWLDDEVPMFWRADLLKLIHATPNLDWLLLTKRPQNWSRLMLDVLSDWCIRGGGDAGPWLSDWINSDTPPANVWIGTTVEDQPRADKRIPHLLRIPARVRFLSCEPLLGSVEIEEHLEDQCDGGYVLGSNPIHWVIAGGESGPKARPMHPDWARSLRDQCAVAGVPFFMKQLGGVRDKRHELADLPEDLRIREFPTP